jgi:hypothetical protein
MHAGACAGYVADPDSDRPQPRRFYTPRHSSRIGPPQQGQRYKERLFSNLSASSEGADLCGRVVRGRARLLLLNSILHDQ